MNSKKVEMTRRYKLSPDKINVIYNGVDIRKFTQADRNSLSREKLQITERFVIGYIGSFYHWQGVEDLVKSFSLTIRDRDDIRLLMVGDGPEFQKVRGIIDDLCIGNKVKLTGAIAPDEIPFYLDMLDVFIIGSNFVSGPKSQILTHDASCFLFTGKYRIEPVDIGDNVFLGSGSIVLPGVKIGNRVIIGAGSVVTNDVPDGVVVASNPARVMCTVEDYINKVAERGVLYSAPFSLQDICNQLGRVTPEQVDALQRDVIGEYHTRNPNSNTWIKYNP